MTAALLDRLVDFAIRRDYPQLLAGGAATDERCGRSGSREVCERTARMVAHWMRVGFVHGVMNTDNMSILGLTIDYGPYGWIDDFDPDWTPNTTDAGGRRYRFGQQPQIAHWNLGRLGAALAPLFQSKVALEEGLERYVAEFNVQSRLDIAAKLGLAECTDGDVALINELHALLHQAEVDMTLFFRALADVALDAPSLEVLRPAFYDAGKMQKDEAAFLDWLQRYGSAQSSTPCRRRSGGRG